MKPKPDEALNTKFSSEERSLLICQTTFEIFKFEKWPHPVLAKTKMDFHVSIGFHASTDFFSLDFHIFGCSFTLKSGWAHSELPLDPAIQLRVPRYPTAIPIKIWREKLVEINSRKNYLERLSRRSCFVVFDRQFLRSENPFRSISCECSRGGCCGNFKGCIAPL